MNKFRKPIIITLLWATLIIFDNYIDKYFGGIVHFFSMCTILVLFIIIIVNIIKELIKIYKSSRSLSFNAFVPLILYLSIPFLCGYIDLDKLDSKVIMRGCYEGTQNQAYILFRQDHSFELNWTGVFFYDKWYTGHWKKNKDTIILQYNNDTVKALGNKLIISNGYFTPVGKHADTVNYPIPMFYLGYCKHEN